jgi:hypothetical protein
MNLNSDILEANFGNNQNNARKKYWAKESKTSSINVVSSTYKNE